MLPEPTMQNYSQAEPDDDGDSAQQDRDLHWSAVLETGAKAIDAHNQSLIFLINALFAPGASCQSETHVCARIEQTISFLVRELGREEATMRASAYPDRRRHKEEHRAILVELQAMKHAYACSRYDPRAVHKSLSGWASRHIEAWDKPLAAHLRKAPPGVQQAPESASHNEDVKLAMEGPLERSD